MDATTYIKQRQILWASRKAIPFTVRNAGGYVDSVNQNLLSPLSASAQSQFGKGSGNELKSKMLALHSSSALAANTFDYWNHLGDFSEIANCLGLPQNHITSCTFEMQHSICRSDHPQAGRFTRPANLDAELHYSSGKFRAAAVESKLAEPYDGHKGLSETYLKTDGIWDELPHCHELAQKLAPNNSVYECLDAPQLLKHSLALRSCYGMSFCLLYLWYEVPGLQSAVHRNEADAFSRILGADRITFQHATYQELILNMAKSFRDQHAVYVDYLAERYL